jgi:polygalacturonase
MLNRDGFSAGGTNLTFENNHIENGDDCLTVGSGAANIVFQNSYCAGGHGLSVGSLGSGGAVASVNNVFINNVVMEKTLYGARFKSWTGGNGLAQNITWQNIFFNQVMFPVCLALFLFQSSER